MHKICFTISLFHASTRFEHDVLIVRRSKLYYTVSGIIKPLGGRPVHRLRQDSLNLCTVRPPIGVMYNRGCVYMHLVEAKIVTYLVVF